MEGPPALPQTRLEPSKSRLIVFVFNMRSGITELMELSSFKAGTEDRNQRIPCVELACDAFRTVASKLLWISSLDISKDGEGSQVQCSKIQRGGLAPSSDGCPKRWGLLELLRIGEEMKVSYFRAWRCCRGTAL